MKIQNEFTISLPPAQAWRVLNDVPRVAKCVPGATLLEQADDGAYVGTVALRLGPIALSFKGKFAYKEIDQTTYRVKAEANGSEQKARGTARALVEFVLAEHAGGTKVSVETDVQLAGSIAQYARGGTLIESTAQVLMDQFAANLQAEINASSPAEEGGAEVAPAPDPAAETKPVTQAPAISAFALISQGLRLAMRRWIRRVFGTRS